MIALSAADAVAVPDASGVKGGGGAVNKRDARRQLKIILSHNDWKFPPCVQVRVLKTAVYFAATHGLELPEEYEGLVIVKLFRLIREREQ